MPVATKAKWAQLRVGLMAIVALVILGTLVFLLAGSQGFFKSKSEVHTYMADSAAIAEGAPVRVNGIFVGKVKHVGLSGSTEPRRVVKIEMQIDNDYLPSIPVDSQAQIAAENLLGTKYINIKKGRSPASIKAGGEIKSLDTQGFDEVVQQGYSALASLDLILKKANGILDAVEVGKGTIGKLLVDETLYNRILGIADASQKLVATFDATLNSDQNSVGKLLHDNGELYGSAHDSVTRINTLIDDIDHGPGLIGKLIQDPALYEEARKTIADVRQVLADVNAGKGTVGKLLKSDELHEQIKGTIARLDAVIDKINNGQGTVGQLMNNAALYESLDATTRELHGLLKDFRTNPKKFLRIKLGLF